MCVANVQGNEFESTIQSHENHAESRSVRASVACSCINVTLGSLSLRVTSTALKTILNKAHREILCRCELQFYV